MNLMMVCLLLVILLFSGFSRVAANVVLIGSNFTLSFDDIEANFAPSIKGSGFFGVLYVAEPLDACSILTKTAEQATNDSSPMLLIIRGGCSFEEKVKRAQTAGFKAVIVYDNEDGGALVAMAGNSAGIKIHAVFVVKATGEELMKHVGLKDMELWLIPSYENSAWSIMAISFISLLAMSSVLATCFFVRRHRMRRERSRASRVREFHGMSSCLVKAMPSLTFTAVLEDNSTSGTCAICLEDYNVGEKLRILPCCHKFHAFCVDSWLTTWRTFCPVCKRDARTSIGNPPASAATPLLSSSPPSVASSSVRSSLASSAIHLPPLSSRSASFSRLHSVASTPHLQHSFRSYGQTPPLSISRSSMDLQNAYSQRSRASNVFSAHSVCRSLSPNTSRYLSPHIPSPSNASPTFLSSSSHQQHPMRFSDSALSFSPFASTYSLPDS